MVGAMNGIGIENEIGGIESGPWYAVIPGLREGSGQSIHFGRYLDRCHQGSRGGLMATVARRRTIDVMILR